MGQQAQTLHDGHHRRRGIEAEGFVAHYLHVRQLLHEVARDEGDIAVGTHQDGDVLGLPALFQQVLHLLAQQLQRGLFVVVGGQQADLHVTAPAGLLIDFLLYIVVGCHLCYLRCLLEEGVVEEDDVCVGAVIGVQRLHVHHLLGVGKLVFDAGQQAPVAVAPAVDALLHIAHDEVLGILAAHRVLQQHLEVLPLHGAGVLELVYHDMFQLRAYLLEDEGRVAAVYQFVKELLRVAQQEAVLLLVQLAHLLLDAAQESQLREMGQREVGALVELPLAGLLVDGGT